MSEIEDLKERERATWQYRMVNLLRGNQTLTGSVLLAILGRAPSNPPRVLCGGVIAPNGVLCTMVETRAAPGVANFLELGPVEAMRDNFRRACDVLDLADDERQEMFGEFRKWIIKDDRPMTTGLDVMDALKES